MRPDADKRHGYWHEFRRRDGRRCRRANDELLSYNRTLSESALISAYLDSEIMRVWSYMQATSTLRHVVSLSGMDPKEVSLHFLRIGMTSVSEAGGDTSKIVIMREGR